MFMLGIVSGRLLDAGYFHHVVGGGSLLYIFSCVPYLRLPLHWFLLCVQYARADK